MELHKAATLAREIMDEHGLIDAGWSFQWNKRVRAAGLCSYRKRTIELSRLMTPKREEKDVRDTILHEVAHALAGPEAKHGWVWRQKARELGARPSTCVADTAACRVPGSWQAVCCGRVVGTRHRRPTGNRIYRHNRCGKPVAWQKVT